jgi:hypothetical protein
MSVATLGLDGTMTAQEREGPALFLADSLASQPLVASVIAIGLLMAMLARVVLWVIALPERGTARYSLMRGTLIGIALLYVARKTSDSLPEVLGPRFQMAFGVCLIVFGLVGDVALLLRERSRGSRTDA